MLSPAAKLRKQMKLLQQAGFHKKGWRGDKQGTGYQNSSIHMLDNNFKDNMVSIS